MKEASNNFLSDNKTNCCTSGAGEGNGQGDSCSQQHAGEDVTAQGVRSEEHDLGSRPAIAALRYAEEVEITVCRGLDTQKR